MKKTILASLMTILATLACAPPLDDKTYSGRFDCPELDSLELELSFEAVDDIYEGEGVISEGGRRLDFELDAAHDGMPLGGEVDVDIEARDCRMNDGSSSVRDRCLRFDDVVFDMDRDEIVGDMEIVDSGLVCGFTLR